MSFPSPPPGSSIGVSDTSGLLDIDVPVRRRDQVAVTESSRIAERYEVEQGRRDQVATTELSQVASRYKVGRRRPVRRDRLRRLTSSFGLPFEGGFVGQAHPIQSATLFRSDEMAELILPLRRPYYSRTLVLPTDTVGNSVATVALPLDQVVIVCQITGSGSDVRTRVELGWTNRSGDNIDFDDDDVGLYAESPRSALDISLLSTIVISARSRPSGTRRYIRARISANPQMGTLTFHFYSVPLKAILAEESLLFGESRSG